MNRRPPLLCWAWLTLLVLAASACNEQPAPPPAASATPAPVVLQVGISDSAQAVTTRVEAAYAGESEHALLNFVSGSNTALFQDLAEDNLDAILVHYIQPGEEVWINPVALDGLTILVHPENRVRELTRAQVQAIYSGQVSNWRELGGEEQPITLLAREPGAGPRLIFNERIMAEQRVSINAQLLPDQEALLAAVAEDSAAIGYAMMGALPQGSRGVSAVAIDGVLPTPNSVGTQNYPLTVPLYFVAKEEPAGPGARGSELRAFLAWLQGPEGQETLGEKYGRVR